MNLSFITLSIHFSSHSLTFFIALLNSEIAFSFSITVFLKELDLATSYTISPGSCLFSHQKKEHHHLYTK